MKKQVVGVVKSLLMAGMVTFSAGVMAQELTIRDGVFSAEQAKTGEAVYESTCKNCHDMKFYQTTLRGWVGNPLLYLWELMLGTMPADNPGSLLPDEYTNVLAYILSENGFPAGDAVLDPDHGMDKISIVAP